MHDCVSDKMCIQLLCELVQSYIVYLDDFKGWQLYAFSP